MLIQENWGPRKILQSWATVSPLTFWSVSKDKIR